MVRGMGQPAGKRRLIEQVGDKNTAEEERRGEGGGGTIAPARVKIDKTCSIEGFNCSSTGNPLTNTLYHIDCSYISRLFTAADRL
jgi:hypothetical protein